jgi:pimeloyl-ACP methyl ester carboxylesterase
MSQLIQVLVLALSVIGISQDGLGTPAKQAAASGLAGRWEGAIELGGGALKLPFAVVFSDGSGSSSGPTGLTATIDIQSAKGAPLRAVSLAGKTVHFELPSGLGVATFDGTFDGTTITGIFVQGTTRGPFTLARPGTVPVPARVPPPYHEEEVTFTNGPITLAGTLTVPEGKGPFPAFVMVTGSGPQNRDEELYGFKIFGVIADYFTRRGVAVLRYDDRGMGGSTGNIAAATTSDFANDALAGLALLAGRPEIDHAHLGVFGHSEGADVAAIAAARSPNVAFIVMMAGMALRGDVILRHQAEDSARALGASDEQVAKILAAHQQLTEAVRTNAGRDAVTEALRALMRAQIEAQPGAVAAIGDLTAYIDKAMPAGVAQNQNPWMKFFVGFDPAVTLAQVKCPVFALFGEKDTQVRPDLNKAPLEAALAKGGNTRVTVKVYPTANHLFIKAVTGQVSEYPTLEKVFVPGMLDDLVAWIRSVTR